MPVPFEYENATIDFRRLLSDARDEADLSTTNQSYTMVQGVLQAFRRRLDTNEALRFASVLPAVARAVFVSDWDLDEPRRRFGDRAAMTAEAQSLRPERDRYGTPAPKRTVRCHPRSTSRRRECDPSGCLAVDDDEESDGGLRRHDEETDMASTHTLTSIGVVASPRTEPIDDDWGDIVSTITLDGDRFTGEVLAGLDDFSHIDVVFVFDRVDETQVHLGARHPRNRDDWPLVGIFAQRAKARPNRLGVTTCELVSVDDLTITVRGLDAIDGTPVLDIKPHVIEFGPRTPVRQPVWIGDLMQNYWVDASAT